MNRCAFGYFVAVIGGIPITLIWSGFLYWLIDKTVSRGTEEPALERVWWLPMLIGIFERTIITTLVAYEISGAAAFIGTWIGIKIAGGWQQWSLGTAHGRSVLFAGLLGSAMSILLALLGGILCLDRR